MSPKISVIGPVYNEAQFIWASIMAVHPYVEEFVYAVSPKSNDGTLEVLRHISGKYGKVKLLIEPKYDFDPHDMKAYNASYNDCIEQSGGDAVWFLHPDMVVTNPEAIECIPEGPMAWWTNLTSYAGDMQTIVTKGRCSPWKNIHAKKFGLTYFGGYGSQNEDFYHTDITGKTFRHFGSEFSAYPFEIADSGINVNHYCELKPYKRRFEKMKSCLKTLSPGSSEETIEESAAQHPRVSLESSSERFGHFEFGPAIEPIPDIFAKYGKEFKPFIKEKLLWQTDTESGLTASPQTEPTFSLR